jgi:hypothetical protein
MEWSRRAATVRVTTLPVRVALAHLEKTERRKQSRNRPRLENRDRPHD